MYQATTVPGVSWWYLSIDKTDVTADHGSHYRFGMVFVPDALPEEIQGN